MERSCYECTHVSCARSHKYQMKDCRYFKMRIGRVEDKVKKPVQRRPDRSKFPKCNRTTCTGNAGRRCEILTDNDFGGKECPFYKNRRDEM